MNDAALVRVGQRIGELHRILEHVAERQRPTRNPCAQRLPFDELHGNERTAVGFTHLVDGADVRMIEL